LTELSFYDRILTSTSPALGQKGLAEIQLRRTTAMLTESHPTRQAPEGKLRQRVHQMRRELNLSEPAYRNVLYSLAGDRYARNLSVVQLEIAVAFLEREASNKRRPVYSAAELAAIHNAQSVEELLGW
jgi:hypothetical protein